jgi:hypothetical protein
MAFKIPYMQDYITKLCRSEAEVILNYVHPNVHGLGQEEATHKKYKRLEPEDRHMTVQLTRCSFRVVA